MGERKTIFIEKPQKINSVWRREIPGIHLQFGPTFSIWCLQQINLFSGKQQQNLENNGQGEGGERDDEGHNPNAMEGPAVRLDEAHEWVESVTSHY